jgi:DnaJ-class molecular chaperone
MSDYYEDGFNRPRGPFVGHNKLGLRDREDERVTIPTQTEPPLDTVIKLSQGKRVERYQRPCKCCDGGRVVIRPFAADADGRCPICHGRGTVTDERPEARS